MEPGHSLSSKQKADNDHLQSQLLRLKNNFREELPGRIHRIHDLLHELQTSLRSDTAGEPDADNLNLLYQHLHKLTGAAGTFGFWDLSHASRHMSDLVDNWLEHANVGPSESLDQLVELAHRLDASETPAVDAPLPQAQVPRQATRRIHIVDDDPEQADQLSLWLKEGGYEVELFHSITVFTDIYETRPAPPRI